MDRIGMAEDGTGVTLKGGGVGGQRANAEAVAEAGADCLLLPLELKGSGEGERVEPGQGRPAGAAEQAGTGASRSLLAGSKGLEHINTLSTMQTL
jgi:hypothetical protein